MNDHPVERDDHPGMMKVAARLVRVPGAAAKNI